MKGQIKQQINQEKRKARKRKAGREKQCGSREGQKVSRKKGHTLAGRGSLLFGILLVVSLVFMVGYDVRQRQAEKLYGELRDGQEGIVLPGSVRDACMAVQLPREEPEPLEEAPVEDAVPHLKNEVDFEALREQNPDVCAWITVPGTRVDYPVLQHPSDDAYYLNHTLEGTAGRPGSIYLEKVHAKDFSSVHTVLYGHNMRNGTMFASLHEYEDAAFFEEHPYIYIHLPEETLVYEIFAAVQFSDAYLPIYRNYEEESGFSSYVGELKSLPGQVNEEVKVPFGSRLLTLSTCVTGEPKSRFLVSAVQAERYGRECY